jgi:hypothetical protein
MADTRSGLRTTVNEDGAAILNLQAGTITTLNPCGAFVWARLERDEDPESIAVSLAHETGKHIELVRDDVAAFIRSLRQQRLLS